MSDPSLSSLDQRVTALEKKVFPTDPPVPPTTTIDAWRKPFSPTSPWNQKINSLGARGNAYFGSKHWPSRAAIPVYVQPASGGTTWTITCPQGTITPRLSAVPTPGADSDVALCLVVGNDVWSYWICTVDSANHKVSAKLGIKCALDGLGFGTAPGSKAGTRASGASLLGGLITAQTLADRSIPHALAAAIPRSCLSVTSPGYVSPATTADSGWQTSYTGNVRMGSRWGISAATPCPSTNVDCQTVWKALQTHGLFVLDADATGLALYLERTGSSDTTVNNIGAIMNAIASSLVPVTSAA